MDGWMKKRIESLSYCHCSVPTCPCVIYLCQSEDRALLEKECQEIREAVLGGEGAQTENLSEVCQQGVPSLPEPLLDTRLQCLTPDTPPVCPLHYGTKQGLPSATELVTLSNKRTEVGGYPPPPPLFS